MIIIGLLAVALACLLIGVVLPSTPWLIASLIATAGAGYVLWRARAVLAGGAHSVANLTSDSALIDTAPAEPEAMPRPEPLPEPAAEPRAPRRSRRKAAADDAAEAATTVLPLDEIVPPDDSPPVAEAVPSVAHVAPAEAAAGDVWVIDGRPRYHLETCAIIQGQDAEPIPFEQATEDGFMPCSLCEPNVVRSGQS